MPTNDGETMLEPSSSKGGEAISELVPDEAINELVAKVRSERLELTNLSGRSCTVSGVSSAHRKLGSSASRNSLNSSRVVVLAPGKSAETSVQIVVAQNFPTSRCEPVTAAGLEVELDGSAQFVPYPFSDCSRSGPAYLTVSALQVSSR